MLYRGIQVKADWAAFSAPEAGGARGRALLEAQGVDTASPPPAPPTGSHKHCLLSPLLGNRKKSGLRPPTLSPDTPSKLVPFFTCAGQFVSGLRTFQQSDSLMKAHVGQGLQ